MENSASSKDTQDASGPPKPSRFWAKEDDEVLQHPLFRLLFECHAATGPIDPAEVNWNRAAVQLGMSLGSLKFRYRNLLDVMKRIKMGEEENEESEKYLCEYETDCSCGDVDSWSDDTFSESDQSVSQHVSPGVVVAQNDSDQELDEGDEETKESTDGSYDSDEGDSDYVYNGDEDEDDDMN